MLKGEVILSTGDTISGPNEVYRVLVKVDGRTLAIHSSDIGLDVILDYKKRRKDTVICEVFMSRSFMEDALALALANEKFQGQMNTFNTFMVLADQAIRTKK